MKCVRIAFLFFSVTAATLAFAGNSGTGEKSATEIKEPAAAPHGMVKITPHFGTDRVTIELDSYARHDRIVEFYNEEGRSLGHVTIWAYSKDRTFVSTLTEGNYTYHVKDGKNTWKGRLVIIN